MKLIIELDDDIAKGIRNENDCEVEPREIVRSFQATIADAIVNGTPITVEHSLLPLASEADNAYMRGYEVGKAEGIMKASTRPQVTVFAENADEHAVADLKAELQNVLDDKRPKGEWGPCYENPRNGKYYKDCSNCGEPTLTGDNNFCPHCGADMRGGAE